MSLGTDSIDFILPSLRPRCIVAVGDIQVYRAQGAVETLFRHPYTEQKRNASDIL